MKLFGRNPDLKSYTYPLIKIGTCLAIIVICIFRESVFGVPNKFLNIIVAIIAFQLTVMCILCIYCSVGELFYVYENRKIMAENRTKVQGPSYVKWYSVEELLSLLTPNDIIDIEIVFKGELIHIGASSNYNYSTGVFYDKLYYIGKTEFASIETFQEQLAHYVYDNVVAVQSIDGLRVNP